jgi:hypothetical protein
MKKIYFIYIVILTIFCSSTFCFGANTTQTVAHFDFQLNNAFESQQKIKDFYFTECIEEISDDDSNETVAKKSTQGSIFTNPKNSSFQYLYLKKSVEKIVPKIPFGLHTSLFILIRILRI